MELILTDNNFETELAKATLPVLVDFYADWCGPCKMLAPVIDELEKMYEGKIVFAKVDVDQSPTTSVKFGVMSIPTIIILKNGQPAKQLVGYQSKETLTKEIGAVI